MATAKKTQVVITANAATAKKVMDELQQRIDQIKAKMQALDVTTKQGQKDFKTLEKELVSYNSAVAQNVSNTERINNAMKNLSGTSLNELKRALSAAKSELGKMSASSDGLKQMQGNVKAIQGQIDRLTQSTKNQGGAWQTAMKNLSAYVGMFAVFNNAKELITGVIKKNLDYSSSLTDIRKVSGLAMADVNKLSNELAKIDTRTSTEGLAELAYQGAKLGMGKYGVEGMAGFVRAADQINVAIGEEMGKEALPALSKMVETMGLIPKMGIEKAMLATGSAMFRLSSTSTSTSGNIVEFAKRLTGVSRTAGITTDQLLALGSASDSLFLMPEVSATAMSKFIVALQKNHNLIEKDLGIQQGTIKQMYAAGHAMDAIVLVLEKMRDKGNMNALGGIFKDLGSDGQRLVTAMVTMSKNVDVLKDHLYESQEAFEEATAVTNEYEMQQTSALGILERANNLWEKAFVNPDGVDNVKMLTQAWYDISQTLLRSPLYNGSLHAALSLVVLAAKAFVALLPLMINYLISAGIAKGLSFIQQMGKAIRSAVVAQQELNLATKVNPYVALASVILTVVGVLWSYVHASQEASEAEVEAEKKANEWKNRLNEAQQETDTLTRKLHAYKTALEQANLSQKDRATQIAKFNRDFRSYITKLGIEIKSVSDLKKHYSELAQEIQRATYYRLREQAKEDALPAYQKDRLNAANRVKQSLQAHKFAKQLNDNTNVQNAKNPGEDDVFTTKMIMEEFARGASANELYRQIITSRYPGAKDIKVDKKTGKYTYTDPKGKKWENPGDQGLLSSLRHYQNATARESAKTKEIDDYFSPFVPDDYTPWVEEEPGTLENDAPDKAAIAEAKRQRREQQKAWREELKQLQDDAQAIMDDVRNFYERQINENLSDAVSLGMDKTEQDLFVEPVKRRMNQALNNVRLAIADQKNNWKSFKSTMDKDLIEPTDATGVNLSAGLLKNIQGNDIAALSAKMKRLSANLNKPYNSTIAEIFAKATKNEQANIKLESKQAEARRKVAQEHDYIGIVQQNVYDDFNTMGYANPSDDEASSKSAFDRRKQDIVSMYETARKRIADLYAVDPTSSDGQGMLIKLLFGDDTDGMGARIKATLGSNADDWQAFYNKLIQYSDQYTEAEKKTYEEAKKIAEQMWAVTQRNINAQRTLTDFQKDASMFGNRTNFASNLGLADNTVDAEVETMRLKMQMAEDYYYFVLQNTKNEQLIAEAEKSRQDAELAYATQMATAMKSRLSQMKSLVDPIVTFGESMGEAFATMESDAESADEAIKSAVKSMLKSWGQMLVNDVNTQMWKAINDAGVNSAKKKAQPGINDARDKGEAGASADAAARAADTLGTKSNPMWVQMVNGQPVDQNGNPTAAPLSPTGNVVQNPDGSQGIAPTGNQSAGGTFADSYLNNQANTSSLAFKQTGAPGTSKVAAHGASAAANAAGGVGAAMANTAVGGGGITEIGQSAAGAAGNALLNTPFIGGSKKKSDKDTQKENRKEIKEAKKQQTKLTNETEKGVKKRTNVSEEGIKDITDATEQGGEDQSKATEIYQTAMTTAVTTALNTRLTGQKAAATEEIATDAGKEEAKMPLSIAGAVGKCFSSLGPIAGPIMAATVTATLTALLAWALSSAFGSSSDSSTSSSSTNTKLKTGMLTYDSGNVQDLKPFVADDGSMYWAKEEDAPKSGVNLLTSPTATTINGQQSIVAENGPELVIGRETTKAMMMNNPSLLKALVNYDSNYSGRRAFDQGNIAETIGAAMQSVQTGSQSSASSDALTTAVNALMAKLSEPITAQINMYGRDGLHERMQQANQFLKGKR